MTEFNKPNIRDEEPVFTAQKCPNCNGYGTLKWGELVCRSCDGAGIVSVNNLTGEIVKVPKK